MANVDIVQAFDYRWAQNTAIQPMDDAQWKAGWAHIGSTPPSVEQFDKQANVFDAKTNYLYAQILELCVSAGITPVSANAEALKLAIAALTVAKAGDTMTGALNLPAGGTVTAPALDDSSGRMISSSWARAGLVNTNLPTSGYIKLPTFMAGLVLQWGSFTMPASGTNVTGSNVTFPIAFSAIASTVIVTPQSTVNSTLGYRPVTNVPSIVLTGFQAAADSNNDAVAFNQVSTYRFFAVGY
jgi:hypothetical protein